MEPAEESGPALPNLTPRHRELVPTPCGPVSTRAVPRGPSRRRTAARSACGRGVNYSHLVRPRRPGVPVVPSRVVSLELIPWLLFIPAGVC